MALLLRGRTASPAQLIVLSFLAAVAVGTVLLSLPGATQGPGSAPPLTALFTATSAVTVTGHVVVDTPTYWSTGGELVILLLIQLGGLGFMTLASLLGLLVFRRLGLRSRLTAQAETRALALGDVRQVLRYVLVFAVTVEAAVAAVLALRLWSAYDTGPGRALYLGLFHGVSAYNNAGFSLFSDNLAGFAGDPVVLGAVGLAVVVGGLGFPVLYELYRESRTPRTWSMHTRLTLGTSAALLLGGFVVLTALEWDGVLGGLGTGDRLLNGLFAAVVPRTAGFNSIDYGDVSPSTLLVTDVLMFIGGGPAGTAGGIKVTTFILLAYVMLAEVRGDADVNAAGRRVPRQAQRQALTVALAGVALVFSGTLALLQVSGLDLDVVLFEAVSAFGTVGLSTGITAALPPAGQGVLIVLMFLGRLGPITLASALALRERPALYRLPEERPVVG